MAPEVKETDATPGTQLHWLQRGVLALESIAETMKLESAERIAQQKLVVEIMAGGNKGAALPPNMAHRTPRRPGA